MTQSVGSSSIQIRLRRSDRFECHAAIKLAGHQIRFINRVLCICRCWTSNRDISGMDQDIKKLCTSSNSTPFRTPWTEFETHNPIDVGEAAF